jgi:hypothetical protein
MITVSIVILGALNQKVDFQYLSKWPSSILKIKLGGSIALLPNTTGSSWEYTDKQLLKLIEWDKSSNFTVALINAPLQDNYYARPLNEKICVMSFYQMAQIIIGNNFSIEQYILRNIYELAVLVACNGGNIPANPMEWIHDDIRGCLFDMNPNKTEIICSMHKPVLCPQCRARLSQAQLEPLFIPTLERELSKIKKTLYARIADWIKAHPLWTLLITAIYGILLNLIASLVFEVMRVVFLK